MLLLASLALLVPPLSIAQSRQGVFHPAQGQPANWSINPNHTLIWNGSPYLPVGLRLSGTAAELASAKSAGIQDAIIEVPAGGSWAAVFSRAEEAGFRYLASVSSIAPMATGYAVEPAAYRVPGITKKQRLELTIPGATSALTVLVTPHDSMVERVGRVKLDNGKLSIDVKPLNDLEHVLLIYPEMTSLSQTDYWEAFDEHRDRLLKSIRESKPGPGLRGIINPLGSLLSIASNTPSFVPKSAYFQAEYRALLERKYKTTKTLQDSWYMSASDLEGFADYARLVPLWSGNRGIYQLWDPKTDRLYPVESKRSSIWTDIQAAINAAAVKRYQRLVKSIRQLVDVPLIQEWAGWAAPYETSSPPVDGLGMRVSGSSASAIAEGGSRVTSSILRWRAPGWLIASDIDAPLTTDTATSVPGVLDELMAIGSRGWFMRRLPPGNVLGEEAARRAIDGSPSQWSPKPVFFPENALNPARPMHLAGGRWWLPSPASGNRIDLGTRFSAYRYRDDSGSFVAIWGRGPTSRIKLRLQQAKGVLFESCDGSDPKPKLTRNGVEVAIGELPLIIRNTDEIPVPEIALQETTFRFEEMIRLAEAQAKFLDEEKFLFRDALAGFDQNPGGNFATMRAIFWRLNGKMGQFNWIEAESSRQNNFSEVLADPGCSGGSVLSLRTSLGGDPTATYFADYAVTPKIKGQAEVWLSARVPAEYRQAVRIVIGGQTFSLQGEAVSRYGAGFGWYKLGVVNLARSPGVVRLEVDNQQGADLAVDVILICPGSFAPNGITPPDSIVFPPTPIRR